MLRVPLPCSQPQQLTGVWGCTGREHRALQVPFQVPWEGQAEVIAWSLSLELFLVRVSRTPGSHPLPGGGHSPSAC